MLRRQLDESAALQAVCGALMDKEADVTKSPQVFWKRKVIMKKNKCAFKRGDNYVSFWEGRFHSLMVFKRKTHFYCTLSFSQMKQRQKIKGGLNQMTKPRGHVSMKTNNGTFFSDIMTPRLDFEA